MSKNTPINGTPANGKARSGTTFVVSTQVPGVDMTQVIASPPHLVKENSAKVDTKITNEVHLK